MRHVGVMVALVGFTIACSGTPPSNERAARTSSPIINGSQAVEYPEAALLGMYQAGHLVGYCSASVVAPQVVLTAGHCVDGFDKWIVTIPLPSFESVVALEGATYDWKENGSETVNPYHHDIGLVFLPDPVTLSAWPVLASAPVKDGTTVVNIGRINNGTLTNALYAGPPTAVYSAQLYGFPYDYESSDVIESGDSGGPDEVPGTTPHLIVAVNSGAGQNTQVLARVDLLKSWIDQQVNAHGGYANAEPIVDAGADTGASEDAGAVEDAGASPGDDAGASAGAGTMTTTSSTGGCSATGKRAGGGALAAIALGIVCVARRRRVSEAAARRASAATAR